MPSAKLTSVNSGIQKNRFNGRQHTALCISQTLVFPITVKSQQLQSTLFLDLMHILGTTHIKTTAYNPCANGLVERFYRQRKTALAALPDQPNGTNICR